MASINIFPIKIYKTKYTGDIEALKKSIVPKLIDCYDKTKEFNQGNMRGDGLCSYNVMRDLHTWPELKEIVEVINEHAWAYWQDLGYDLDKRPGVYEMWSNVYKNNSFIDAHSHAPIHMTCSFYLQMPVSGGNLAFENPLSTLLKHQPYPLNDIRYGASFDHEVEVETGDIVFFPGWITHKTRPNNSTEDRIIVGANICNVV